MKFHKIYLINLRSLTGSSVSQFILHAPAPEQEDAVKERFFMHNRLANFTMIIAQLLPYKLSMEIKTYFSSSNSISMLFVSPTGFSKCRFCIWSENKEQTEATRAVFSSQNHITLVTLPLLFQGIWRCWNFSSISRLYQVDLPLFT